MVLKRYSREEIANSLTHLAGALLAPVMLILLLATMSPEGQYKLLAAAMFCSGVFLLYTSSTCYHWALPGRLKSVLRYIDHINIYVLIAASYTPILICAIGGVLGWTMFFVMWALALLGAVYKIFFLKRWRRLSLGLYLLMGWSCVFIAVPVWQSLPASALCMILAEGIFYTSGSYFFMHDSRPYYHTFWHIFVLLGTLSHFAAVWIIMV